MYVSLSPTGRQNGVWLTTAVITHAPTFEDEVSDNPGPIDGALTRIPV